MQSGSRLKPSSHLNEAQLVINTKDKLSRQIDC